MEKDVIIACDFASADELYGFLDKLGDEKPYLKIGMELYYAVGPEIVKKLKARGCKLFLDLKLHDIPNTVKKAMAVLSNLNADMVNVHTSGGIKMMEAALEGLTKPDGTHPILIGVTQLTSTSDEMLSNELLIEKSMEETVSHYAKNAKTAGLSGVVCSPWEAKKVKEVCGADFLTVTPGIRFADGEKGDQVRIATPEKARILGSDYIVVGRPITQAQNPKEAYLRCKYEFLGI